VVEGERIAAVGKLDFIRKYGAETGSQTPFLSVWPLFERMPRF
jgi:hypothetical protein